MTDTTEMVKYIADAISRLPHKRLLSEEIAEHVPYSIYQVSPVLGMVAKGQIDAPFEVRKIAGDPTVWEFQGIQHYESVAYVLLESLERGTRETQLGPNEKFQESNDEPTRITVITND